MAILAIVACKGLTKAHYESLRKTVNWEGHPPMGLMFHAAGFDDSGSIRVADVWDSKESMEAFFKVRLLPAIRSMNCPEPAAEMFPLHNANAMGSLDRFKLLAHA